MLAATFYQPLAQYIPFTPEVLGQQNGQQSGQPEAPAGAAAPSDPCAPVIASLPSRRQLAQLIQVGVKPEDSQDALAVVNAEQVGGIFIGGDAPGLLTGGALALVRAASKVPITVSVDDEGGRVQRIDNLDGSIPSARQMAATMSPEQVRELAKKRGGELQSRGVTMDLAPVVDTSAQADNTVIGDRSFSADPAVARKYAEAFAAGLRDAGVEPVLKHFPGHGNANGDSHLGVAATPPLDVLRGRDLVPYQNIASYGEVAVMVGHLDVPGLTEGKPATLSPAAYALLRKDYAFNGLVMTDDLGAMKAVTDVADLPEAVRIALASGADVALWSTGGRVGEVLDRLEQALKDGGLAPERVSEALHRVLKSKGLC
jgi:beta-N-acetylhexosaminidase